MSRAIYKISLENERYIGLIVCDPFKGPFKKVAIDKRMVFGKTLCTCDFDASCPCRLGGALMHCLI